MCKIQTNENNKIVMSETQDDKTSQQQSNEDFLKSLKFSNDPFTTLAQMKRTPCPTCKKKYKYFCYTCMKTLPTSGNDDPTMVVPHSTLPLKVIIIQHKNERKSKSTAIHSKILYPESVEIYEYPDIPQELVDNGSNALLLYPSPDAISVQQVIENNAQVVEALQSESTTTTTNTDKALFKYVVFIDSTWQQSKSIFRDERLSQLTRAKITAQKTKFWRYQQHGDEFLATIEAIYFFFREYSIELNKLKNKTDEEQYNGEYDDLLYFYAFQYDLIQKHYNDHPDISFTTKKGNDYIQYNKRNREQSGSDNAEEDRSAKKQKL